MKFWKKLTLGVVLLSVLGLYLLPGSINAQNEFSVDANVTYSVQETGKTVVTHAIVLENNISTVYATTYTLSLENIDVANVKAFSDKGDSFPVEISKDGGNTNIKVSFPDTVVGKGVQRNFSITYENSSFAVRTGEVWEISIPRLGDQTNFRNYQLTLNVPKSFGLEAYISPKPESSNFGDGGYTYTYNKNNLLQTGVNAGYGQFQVFSFNLSYHLENPLSVASNTQIALPPDTAFQKVYLQKINPKPTNVTIDSDGNWLAIYDLSPRQRLDVSVSGSVQIFASYRSFPEPTNQELSDNLKDNEYWQVTDPKIRELATKLKTPRAIYNYVSQNLHYDVSRVQPNVQRMGALGALQNPNQAICMEFTDLFIALARAAGIPAREIEGFAYTENPDLQPLGLVADVLHSWPEYYDKDKGAWIPIDPTWGSTTGGVDFFDKLDLRHFAFVIHGRSSKEPYPPGSYKLGPNPQKDVFVSFGQLPENKISIPTVTIKPYRILPFFSSIYSVTVGNPGPVALYSVYPVIYFDSSEKTTDFINILPPFSNDQIQVTLPYSFLGKDMPSVIKVTVNGSESQILTNKKQIVLGSLLAISFVLIIIMAFVFIRIKRINIFSIFAKIGARKAENEKPNTQTPENKVNT
jgi:transglutaminase-like putative cysteine protease